MSRNPGRGTFTLISAELESNQNRVRGYSWKLFGLPTPRTSERLFSAKSGKPTGGSVIVSSDRLFRCLLVCWCGAAIALGANANAALEEKISRQEAQGDLAGARSLLEQQANTPGNTAAAADLAEFLDRHGDSGRRNAYLKWASEETDSQRKLLALRQAVLIDFISQDRKDLATDLASYRAAGGTDFTTSASGASPSHYSTVSIPGPLSSFARMAALSPDLAAEDLLPALARNIVTNGYEATSNESLQPTEYLRLLLRYVGQARELQSLAGAERKIVIPNCDSEQTANLLKVIGYRMRGSCGADIVLETVNPTRAFITVDSGFPLTQLEQDLRANRRFELAYAPTVVPVLYDAKYWLSATGRTDKSDFLDAFTSDALLCRLYLGLSHVELPVAEALRKQANPLRLRLYANVLDFYGGMFPDSQWCGGHAGKPESLVVGVGRFPVQSGSVF